ncbi:MAG TPA: DUF4112 domain-containing protein [Rhizomicrobium sp.]|nr:DUF4112 domain-containing protein [Rhizomicrobium sp.]
MPSGSLLRAEPVRSFSEADELAHIDMLADLMDSKFRLPGTGIRFGIDSLVGLVPVAGDAIGALVSFYIVARVWERMPPWTRTRMIWNILVDFGVGSIPVLGDAFDVAFKSNRKNVALARRALAKQPKRKTRKYN